MIYDKNDGVTHATMPQSCVKAKPFGCFASLRSLDTGSLAWLWKRAPLFEQKTVEFFAVCGREWLDLLLTHGKVLPLTL